MSAKTSTEVVIDGKVYTLSGYRGGGLPAESCLLYQWQDQ